MNYIKYEIVIEACMVATRMKLAGHVVVMKNETMPKTAEAKKQGY